MYVCVCHKLTELAILAAYDTAVVMEVVKVATPAVFSVCVCVYVFVCVCAHHKLTELAILAAYDTAVVMEVAKVATPAVLSV